MIRLSTFADVVTDDAAQYGGDVRWSYDGEMYAAWIGPVLVGSVSQVDHGVWESWALGETTTVRHRKFRAAQKWVEKRAEDTCSA